jgi:hypothetical protein
MKVKPGVVYHVVDGLKEFNCHVFYLSKLNAELDCSKKNVKTYIKIYIKMLLRVSI